MFYSNQKKKKEKPTLYHTVHHLHIMWSLYFLYDVSLRNDLKLAQARG